MSRHRECSGSSDGSQFAPAESALAEVFLVDTIAGLKIETHEWSSINREQVVPPLHDGEVQVWHWPLHASNEVDKLRDLLSADELARAESFRFDKHRNEFVLTRSTLRLLLASHASQSPETLVFKYSGLGKPTLEDNVADLHFSVSHTDGMAALAIVKRREVGVDVERLRPEPDAHKLAKRFFSESEGAFLDKLSGQELIDAFFRCWTLKEAYVKAKGGGLSIPLRDFDVSLEKNSQSALLQTRPDPSQANRWTLQSLPMPPDYAAALAVANLEHSSTH